VRWLTESTRTVLYPERVSHLLEFFYSDHCLSCPEARQALQRLAAARADVVIVERNIDDDAAYAQAGAYSLIATPAFVIDRRDVMYGVPGVARLVARIAASTPVLD
jgi:thiol-disulfide isomerase/thioredoxin